MVATTPRSLEAANQDADLLRLALAKIEELQGQVNQLQGGSETSTATPATTPRGSPTGEPAPSKTGPPKKKGDGNDSDDDKTGEEEPIRTPDGVAVPWLQAYNMFSSIPFLIQCTYQKRFMVYQKKTLLPHSSQLTEAQEIPVLGLRCCHMVPFACA